MSAKETDAVSNAPTENADTNAMRIKFIFANRDGVHVEIECSLNDTIAAITQDLHSKWPKDIDETPPDVDRIRLICMGKGILGPPDNTVESCEIPIFTTHPTPVNVSVKPIITYHKKSLLGSSHNISQSGTGGTGSGGDQPSGDCCCVIS